jgi:hypothetical protein
MGLAHHPGVPKQPCKVKGSARCSLGYMWLKNSWTQSRLVVVIRKLVFVDLTSKTKLKWEQTSRYLCRETARSQMFPQLGLVCSWERGCDCRQGERTIK